MCAAAALDAAQAYLVRSADRAVASRVYAYPATRDHVDVARQEPGPGFQRNDSSLALYSTCMPYMLSFPDCAHIPHSHSGTAAKRGERYGSL